MIKFILLLLIMHVNSFAERLNINKVTSEFADHDAFIEPIKNIDDTIIQDVLKPSSCEDYKHIEDFESEGIKARNEKTYFNILEVDYSKPGSRAHKSEVDIIVSDTNSKLYDLTAFLRKSGIDCQPSTNSNNSSSFYLDSEMLPIKEVSFKPVFCEQLQNKYHCTRNLKINCLKKSMLWNEWSSKTIKVSADELKSFYPNPLFADHVAARIFELKLFNYGDHHLFNSVPAIKLFLSKKHNCSIENINDSMNFSWEGGVTHLGEKDYQWNIYVITYQYRDGKEICEKWSEEKWEENCSFG